MIFQMIAPFDQVTEYTFVNISFFIHISKSNEHRRIKIVLLGISEYLDLKFVMRFETATRVSYYQLAAYVHDIFETCHRALVYGEK